MGCEIEIGELEAGGDGGFAVDGAGRFEACAGVGAFGEFDFDAEEVAGGDEGAVFYVAGVFQDGH